jgi:hypothetical protein
VVGALTVGMCIGYGCTDCGLEVSSTFAVVCVFGTAGDMQVCMSSTSVSVVTMPTALTCVCVVHVYLVRSIDLGNLLEALLMHYYQIIPDLSMCLYNPGVSG